MLFDDFEKKLASMSTFFRIFAKNQNITDRMTKKVLFINQEISPYVPSSEMSEMGCLLPQKIQEAGYEIRTFMPKWGNINERRGQLHEVQRLSGMNLIINDTDHPIVIKVASIPNTRVQVYFIDNDEFFLKRQMTENEKGEEYTDNGERAVFFARGVLETVKKLRWAPDIIHCQGWMSAVLPLYIKTAYQDEPSFANTKVVTSLFQSQMKGDLGDHFKSALAYREVTAELLKPYKKKFDFLELGKLAIDYSDAIVEAGKKVNKPLLNYVADKELPLLKYPGEDFGEAYLDFYNTICPDGE